VTGIVSRGYFGNGTVDGIVEAFIEHYQLAGRHAFLAQQAQAARRHLM